jgi:hypothetical protein
MKTVEVIRHLAFENLGTWVPLLVARIYTVSDLEAGSKRVCVNCLVPVSLLVVLPHPKKYSTR